MSCEIRIGILAMHCCKCGILFGICETVAEKKKDDGTKFYCTNGHRQYFIDTYKIKCEKLEELLKKERAINEMNEAVGKSKNP